MAKVTLRDFGSKPDEWQARVDLAACYRLVAHFEMTDLIYTHITIRAPGTKDQFFINPFGTTFDEVTASSLVKIDVNGKVIEPGAGGVAELRSRVNPAGFIIHSAIHMQREDAHCVLHTHSRAGMAVAAMKEGLLPLNQKGMMFYNRIAYHDYEGLAFEIGERERLQRDLGRHKALILRNHGLLTVGNDCAEAFSNMYSLEIACRLQVDALAMGRELVLPSPEACEHAARQFESLDDTPSTREWPHLLRLLDRVNPGYRD
ncbi:MAG: class II aldolase/adducin family protein [Betaproteobacteria bacterium]|nr:class II aldolase/adducin family protein [Betaproteobacteria bacterium]